MKISTWLDKKMAENIDVSQIELPAEVSYDNDPDETIFFEEYKPCGYFCAENHPFSTVERYGVWYYSRGQDKKAGIHSSEMKWHIFTKDKELAVKTAKAHLKGEKKMAKKMEVYKCEVCGNIVEMLHGGDGELVCCDQPMKLKTENTVDAAKEKHVPVIEKVSGGVTVKVGSVAHPMEEKHSIEWIEIIADGKAYRQFLNPGDKPEASFQIKAEKIRAREYCNLHGLWSA